MVWSLTGHRGGAPAFALGEMEPPEGSEQWRTWSDVGVQCPSRWVREETRGRGRGSREEGEQLGKPGMFRLRIYFFVYVIGDIFYLFLPSL